MRKNVLSPSPSLPHLPRGSFIHSHSVVQMMVFLKGNEKKERESRKKADKEALDKSKKKEEVRETKRAARKLNFLITQTDLYSQFVSNQIKIKPFRFVFSRCVEVRKLTIWYSS